MAVQPALTTPYELTVDHARARDEADPLRAFRERFYARPDRIYLDGNSLGLASRDAEAAVLAALDDWKTHAVDGWTDGERPWFGLGEELGALQAAVVGAEPDELVVTGTTTVNLHALVATFYRPEGRRTKILADELNFPSDLYALASQVRLRGYDPREHLILAKSRDGRTLDEADLIEAMADDVALVLLPSVLYRSGQLLDLERLAAAARERGVPIGFDCSHSAGVVPHCLHDWGVDFATWCTYKYLNAGPGAVGALFVHRRHFGAAPGLAGWWGHHKERQFDMLLDFEQAPHAGAWQIGTPTVLGAAALRGALDITLEAGLGAIRAKSLDQTGYLIYLVDKLLAPLGFVVGTPRDPTRRGGHVALEHPEAIRIARALKARGIIPDFRFPNVVRLAPIPLYTTYAELHQTAQTLRDIIATGAHLQFPAQRAPVA